MKPLKLPSGNEQGTAENKESLDNHGLSVKHYKLHTTGDDWYKAFENASAGIIWLDPAKRSIINCNKAAQALLETTHDDLIGKDYSCLHSSKSFSACAISYERFFEAKQNSSFESEIRTLSGRIYPVSMSLSMTSISSGPAAMLIFHDICSRKDNESRQKLTSFVLEILNRDNNIQKTLKDVLCFIQEQCGFDAIELTVNDTNGLKINHWVGVQSSPKHSTSDLQQICNANQLNWDRTNKGSVWTGSASRSCSRCGFSKHFESIAAIPILNNDNEIGQLRIFDIYPHRFSTEMITFFEGLCSSISMRLSRHRIKEELVKTKDELEGKVIQRTQELANIIEVLQEEVLERTSAEDALKQQQAMFDAFMDHFPGRTFIKNSQGRYLFFNKYHATELGWDSDQNINKTNHELWPRELAESFTAQDKEVLKTGKAKERTFTANVNGHQVWYSCYKFPIFRPDLPPLLGGISFDITAKVEIEKALRQSEEKYRDLVESANSIIMRRDINGNIVFLNSFAHKFFGYDKEEIIGKPLVGTIVPEKDRSGRDMNKLISDISENPESYKINENENITHDGRKVWISWTNTPIRDKNGKVVEILAVGNDITKRKRAEDALHESEEKYRRLVELSPDGIAVVVRNRIAFVNTAGKRILGTKPGENLISKSVFEFVEPQNYELFKRLLNCCILRKRKISPAETSIVSRSGKIIDTEIAATPLMYKNKPAVQIVFRDICERKTASRKLLHYQNQLRSLTAQLLLAEERERRHIASELHDSVGQILAFTKIGLGSLQNNAQGKVKSSLAEMREHVENALQQTRTLTFDLSPPTLYTIGVSEAIEELVEQFTSQKEIVWNFRRFGSTEELGDELKVLIYRSTRELLVNAVKHASPSNVTVFLENRPGSISVTVTDDGCGFDTDMLKKADNNNRFGLFSISERIRHMNGKFEITSQRCKGTVVTFSLPTI